MNSFTLRPARLVVVLLALVLLTAVLAQPIVTARRAATAAPAVSCPASLSATGPADYHGATLTMCNFAKRSLRGANFSGATLTAVVFIGADLTLGSGDSPLASVEVDLAPFGTAQFTGPHEEHG